MGGRDYKGHMSKIKVSNMIYPILIGLGVVGYMLYREFDPDVFSVLHFTWKSVLWIFIAFLFMFGRDIGYIIRIRILSDNKLTWMQAFRVIMLWEFTSAITPSAIGGTSFAIIYVHKEGISVGKSSAIVLLTSFFDELYFIVMFPLVTLLVGKSVLFDVSAAVGDMFAMGLLGIALTGYFLKLIYTLFVSYGLFINPKGLKWILLKVFRIRFLRKWYRSAVKTGDDIIASSKEIKTKKLGFWVKAVSASFLSWSSRYLVVNAILLGFFVFGDHLLLFARQLVMWIMMLIMPTPGGSGFSEFLFKEYLSDFIPVDVSLQFGVAALLALLWRLITYYPYLIIGAVIFPRWLKRNFGAEARASWKKPEAVEEESGNN